VGLFAAVGSVRDDGFHTFDEGLGGYAYYGMYNGSDAVIGAHYTDGQLPLTLHHEWFHHLDATNGSRTDDTRFAAALSADDAYAAPALTAADRVSLERRSGGAVLRGAVGDYASKSAGEDQAETARYLHSHLPDALLQVVERPGLAGSQRMLHVIAEQEAATGAGFDWLVDVALDRASRASATAERIRPADGFVVYGGEDEDGVNWQLRADVQELGAEIATADPAEVLAQIALVADYHAYIDSRWDITPGTRRAFEASLSTAVDALPASHRMLGDAIRSASLEQLSVALDPDDVGADLTTRAVGAIAAAGADVNPYVANVDHELGGRWRGVIRAAQPATVRVSVGSGAGSGVNIAPRGLILTAAHVPDTLGRTARVTFPDGTVVTATTVASDSRRDLALLEVAGRYDLPSVGLARSAPGIGDAVAIVGQPGTTTPDGDATGYQPFHVSVGNIRIVSADPLSDQGLGGVGHDAWTYWGHSGSPLFDEQGRIVALHNSWDSRTAMRHAVTWHALDQFVGVHRDLVEARR
jgi:S1-C subfamily serine protease